MKKKSFAHCLGDLPLAEASPAIRTTLERLVSSKASERLEGLGEVGSLAEEVEALPYLVALARHRDYPQASAVLVRLSATLARIDSPPRLGGAPAQPLVEALSKEGASLLRVARTSRDPESARAAARILGHLPAYDAELAPLFLALLGGAADATERAPLLYFLTRIQLARGDVLHPRIERARSAPMHDPEHVAVLLALEDAGAVDDATSTNLAELRATAATARLPDPRVWGRSL